MMTWPYPPTGDVENTAADVVPLLVVEMMGLEYRRTYLIASSHQVPVAVISATLVTLGVVIY
jgi:hypothetical protein